MEIIPTIIGLLFAAVLLGIYVGSAAWAIGDAQKRGHGGGIIVLLFWLCGPVSAIIWLILRPPTKLIDRSHDDYNNADDAIAAASRLDSIGDWDAAIALYQDAAKRWPEHDSYIQECIKQINEKQSLT